MPSKPALQNARIPKPNGWFTQMTANPLSALRALFVNRSDCYCIQLKQGYSKIPQPLTDQILQQHLDGKTTVGSYQLDTNNLVKWLCLDLDPEKLSDHKETAKQILSILLQKTKDKEGNETPRIWPNCIVLEASRYPDPSYHIWLLFLIPLEAKAARWIGQRILEMANLSPKQIEVFPKQNEITPERPYGNFVKLPFGKHQVEGKWSRLLDLETFEPLPIKQLEDKHGLSFSKRDIEKLQKLEPKKNIQIAFEAPKTSKKLTDQDEEKTVQFLIDIWREGYRNEVTLSFCGMCIKKGVNHESARRIIEEVCKRTDTPSIDTLEFLSKVDYQFKHRTNIGNLKGSSGIREVIEAIKEADQKNHTAGAA